MKKVVIVNGPAEVGKDHFALFVGKHNEKSLTSKLSTIDDVKKLCSAMGVNPNEKTEKNRWLWAAVKNLWSAYNDGPFRAITDYINNHSGFASLFIVMAREPREIAKFKAFYGKNCITVLIRRPGIHVPDNPADKNVENYDYDYIYDNSGTIGDLENAAKSFVEEWIYGNE